MSLHLFAIKNLPVFTAGARVLQNCKDTVSSFFTGYYDLSCRYLQDTTSTSSAMTKKDHQVVIIGSGPAGNTAAIYAARAGLKPLVYEGSVHEDFVPGGQLMTTTKVENFPGFPEGIEGPTLMKNLRKQAENCGAVFLKENVTKIDLSKRPFSIQGEKTSCQAPAVILAMGAKARRLDIPGTRDGELWQKGVSSCATCDGPLPIFRNKPVFVIGGGDTAMEEALFLSKFASKVFVVHRRDKLRASKAMQKAVLSHPKIEILFNSTISKVEGAETVERVGIQNLKTKKETIQEASGVFFAVGHVPNNSLLPKQIKVDTKGYIQVQPGSSRTNIAYVYAAGDLQDPTYHQASTAVGSGCMAAIDAQTDLSKPKKGFFYDL